MTRSLMAGGSIVILAAADLLATPAVAAADPPGAGIVKGWIGQASGWAWSKVADGITGWVLGALGYFVNGVVNFLKTQARPDPGAVWFSGDGSPYATVRGIAGVLLVGFLFIGILSGLAHGDIGGMVRRMVLDLPVAVVGMTVTIAVVGELLALTDALSTAVLGDANGQALKFLSGFGTTVTVSTGGFAAVLVGLVAVLAAFLVWVELMVRSALVYLLVAISPLGFAALVWPAARGVLRKLAELLVAAIVSKFVICVALGVGVAALSGAGGAGQGASTGTGVAESTGALLVGGAVLIMAAFSPFLVLKLVPIAEAALVAHGVSRGPVRAGQSGMSSVYYARSMTRLAGHASGSSARTAGQEGPGTGYVTGGPMAAGGAGSAGSAVAGSAVAGPVAGVAAAAAAAQGAAAAARQTARKAASVGSDPAGAGGAAAPRDLESQSPPSRDARQKASDPATPPEPRRGGS